MKPHLLVERRLLGTVGRDVSQAKTVCPSVLFQYLLGPMCVSANSQVYIWTQGLPARSAQGVRSSL